jgi:DNA-binding transcriptional regulator YiaG
MNDRIGSKPPTASAILRKCGAEISRRELRDARRALGLTPEGAALLLGVGVDTIKRQEAGDSRVDAGLLCALRELAQQRKTGT